MAGIYTSIANSTKERLEYLRKKDEIEKGNAMLMLIKEIKQIERLFSTVLPEEGFIPESSDSIKIKKLEYGNIYLDFKVGDYKITSEEVENCTVLYEVKRKNKIGVSVLFWSFPDGTTSGRLTVKYKDSEDKIVHLCYVDKPRFHEEPNIEFTSMDNVANNIDLNRLANLVIAAVKQVDISINNTFLPF